MRELEVYPFWKLRDGKSVEVRFLPDLNEQNVNGFVDRYSIHRVTINDKNKMALCSTIHEDNQTCFHCVMAKRAFNKGSSWNTESLASWRKEMYTANVIIVNDPLGLNDPDNPKTYRLMMGKQLFNCISDGLIGGKVTTMPSDYQDGNNFIITSDRVGKFPRYTGEFTRTISLTTEQIKLAKESLVDLSDYRPKLYSSECQDNLSKDLCWEILGND